MKFSIIIPVYNVEKYIRKCLESVINQTYQDFEAIIVNDGTQDNSQRIIDEFAKEYPSKVRSYIKDNSGLSDTRNYGIERANGEYIVFLDSDDYLDINFLSKMNEVIERNNDVDVIGFDIQRVNLNGEKVDIWVKPDFEGMSGEEAICRLVESKQLFEPACGYVYRLAYLKENNFKFQVGVYHEDFGLIPIVILRAKKVTCIDFVGYYYVLTDNSIMRNNSLEKERKKANDLIKAFDFLEEEIDKIEFKNNYSRRLLNAYIANSMLYRANELDKSLVKDYKRELVKRKVTDLIIDDSFKRKIRKLLMKIKFSLL